MTERKEGELGERIIRNMRRLATLIAEKDKEIAELRVQVAFWANVAGIEAGGNHHEMMRAEAAEAREADLRARLGEYEG